MKKGEIRVVKIPKTKGYEQYGTRPCIVVADVTNEIAIIVPFTSNVRALRFPHTIEIEPNNRNGLNKKSIALVFQVRAIDKKRLGSKIGKSKRSNLKELNSDLKEILEV